MTLKDFILTLGITKWRAETKPYCGDPYPNPRVILSSNSTPCEVLSCKNLDADVSDILVEDESIILKIYC